MESGAPTPSIIDVLIVDHDEDSARVLACILHDNGLHTLWCNAADAVIALTKLHQPGLILLDVNLPQRNGFDTCTALKTDPATANIPVIFITTTHAGNSEATGFAVGGVDYILKPFNAATVYARVNTHLQWYRHQASLEEQIARRTQSLNDALRELARASRVKDEFLAMASHELRTPLNGLVGSLHLLQHSTSDTAHHELICAAQSCTNNLSYIVENILVISEINAGTLKMVARPFAIRHGLISMMKKMEVDIRDKSLLLDFAVDDDVADNYVGDGYHLFRALLMIFSNAVKFTPSGAISLRVSARPGHDVVTALVSFKISDTGIGIASEIQPRLFALFEPGDASVNRRYGGFGVGLALTSALVREMNGSVTFESQPGAGSIFTVTLPLRIATIEEAAAAAIDLRQSHIPAGKTVLIVEDNEVNLLVQRAMIERLGIGVLAANNGQQALEMLEHTAPHLILMDCQMPVLDGFEATRHIRRLPSALGNIPIIAVTANATSLDRERCFAAGMNDYIQKPVNPHHLIATLSKWLTTELT